MWSCEEARCTCLEFFQCENSSKTEFRWRWVNRKSHPLWSSKRKANWVKSTQGTEVKVNTSHKQLFRNTSRHLATDSCSLSNPCYVKLQLTDQNKRKVLGCEKIKRRLQGRINAFHQKLMRLTIQIYKQTWFNRSFYVNCASSAGPFEHVVKI